MKTLIINEDTQQGKAFLEYAKKLPFVKIVKEKPVAKEIRTALKEVKTGKRKPIENLFA